MKTIYEDSEILIIDKPSGVPTFPTPKSTTDLDSWAKEISSHYTPIHRLDQPTSGLVMIAKNANSLRVFSELFQKREIQKRYHLITLGNSDLEFPTYFHDSFKTFQHRGKKKASLNKIHNQRVIEEIKLKKSEKNCLSHVSLVEKSNQALLFSASPITGRYHQLRVQFAKRGLPIVNDFFYGFKASEKYERLMLDSYEISFIHPISKKDIIVTNEKPLIKVFEDNFQY